jgi:hypothetical protein
MVGQDELQEFQKWVHGLSWKQLLVSMEFAFSPDNTNNSSSQELELLKEMIHLQAPSPTPIHPRAVPFRPASAQTATDGRNDWARIRSDRFHRPRLFQWIPQNNTNTPQLMLPSASGLNSSRRLSSSRSAAWKRQPPVALFHITARKFVGQDGTRYSLACTEEQRVHDEAVLRGTCLVHPPDASIVYGRFNPTKTNNGNLVSNCTSANNNTRVEILRMLQVVSRGQFMTKSWRSKNQTVSSAMPYTAPWFHPTERWFSLPMYLASRFEVALWKSFGTYRASQLPPPRASPCSCWRTTMEFRLPADVIFRAIGRSVADTLALQVLPEDASCVPRLRDSLLWNILLEYSSGETASPLTKWLAKLQQDTTSPSSSSLSHVLDGLLACPLTHVGAPIDRLRRLVRQRLYLLLSQEMEQVLLRELTAPDMDETATTTIMTTQAGAASATKKKKNKKKRVNKRKKGNLTLPLLVDRAPTTLSQVTESSMDVNEEDSSSEENSGASPSSNALELTTSSNCIEFPDNGTNRRDRNRNTVLVMSILEDIMHAVHVEVGLEVVVDIHFSGVGDQPDEEKEQEQMSPNREQGYEGEPSQRSLQHDSTDGPVWEPGDDAVFQPIDASSTVDALSYQPAMDDSSPNVNRTSLDMFSNHYGTHGGGFFYRSEPFDFTWGLTDAAMDDWGRVQGFASRDRSILTEFFPAVSSHVHERVDAIIAERIMASSTAASIASSSKEDDDADSQTVDKELETAFDPLSPIATSLNLTGKEVSIGEKAVSQEHIAGIEDSASPQVEVVRPIMHSPERHISESEEGGDNNYDYRSPSPQPPSTPSPTLSPILVSLADLRRIQPPFPPLKLPSSSLPNSPNETTKPKLRVTRSREKRSQSSLPNSPNEITKPKLRTSRSRERADVRGTRQTGQGLARSISEAGRASFSVRSVVPNAAKSTDDYDGNGKATTTRRSIDALAPYRSLVHRHSNFRDDTDINKHVRVSATRPIIATALSRSAATKASAKSVSSARTAGSGVSAKPFSHLHFDSAPSKRTGLNDDVCARSDNSMTETDDSQHQNDSRQRRTNEDAEDHAVSKDWETTSITSALSHRESEDVTTLREERNTYRDMCLTLGAEVAKLKNMLAAQRGAALYQDHNYIQGVSQPLPDQHAFDPQAVSRFFKSTPRARTLAAMSDAGLRGEHGSVGSEDDMRESGGRMIKADTLMHNSSATIAGSDVTWDHASSHVRQLHPPTRDLHDTVSLNGTHSRLSKDILKFLHSTDMQLKKQNTKRLQAVERMTRLVKAVWPRAQVKLYGSHVTGLCVPSSDLDFVVCLPAVHKNAPAVAPGALEGRNAVNESSQRLLARRLKGESWIDPRSMKLIERTVVPVIKVATKDTKARTLQLDITFDSPGHHGLEAVEMVTQTMVELPMLRPLVLVLKQFLLDRCLLTAYTGGLSSYCLFLMVARYLQEQPSSWGVSDWGSLLMGFLDFYGNCVS